MSNSAHDFPLTNFLVAFIFSLLLILLSWKNHLNWLSTPLNTIFTPLRIPLTQINQSTNQLLNQLHQIPNSSRLIKDLQRQNASLALVAQQSQDLAKENIALRSVIRSPISGKHKLLPTKIIGLSRFAIINIGADDNVKPGQAVVVDDTLLGIIASISPTTAKIKLLSDPEFSISAITNQNSAGQVKFVTDHLELSQILQKEPLLVGDRVFTKGGDAIPDGLLIGTVTKVNDNPAAVYQIATINPAASVIDQQVVFVILE